MKSDIDIKDDGIEQNTHQSHKAQVIKRFRSLHQQ
nr:MAG TPA_asm: hypothetical protein [Caudoviricetes sp.]